MNYDRAPDFPYVTVFLLVIIVLALIGCGGGDSGDNSDTGPARVQLPTVDCDAHPEQCE